jgi:hypothetical protein
MTANKYFENVTKLWYKRMAVKYHIQKEMDLEKDSYHLVRNILYSLFSI